MLSKKLLPASGRHRLDKRAKAIRGETTLLIGRLLASQHAAAISPGGRLGFVGPIDAEPALVTATNVAIQVAGQGRRTALIECDVRQPRLAAHFGLAPAPGLVDLLRGEASIADIPRVSPELPLIPITVDEASSATAQFTEFSLDQLFDGLDRAADVTILALPRLLSDADSLALLQRIDAAVLVVPANRTRRKEVQRAADLLVDLRVPLAGTVLTDTEYPLPVFLASRL